jgi:hypothetical protein
MRALGARMMSFTFRGLASVFVDAPFWVEAKDSDAKDDLVLWVRDPGESLDMRASAHRLM